MEVVSFFNTFWVIFLILFVLGAIGVILKMFGKSCYEKISGEGKFAHGYGLKFDNSDVILKLILVAVSSLTNVCKLAFY